MAPIGKPKKGQLYAKVDGCSVEIGEIKTLTGSMVDDAILLNHEITPDKEYISGRFVIDYSENKERLYDICMPKPLWDNFWCWPESSRLSCYEGLYSYPEIERVIFNNPVTIVIWKDGTKTIVRAQDGDKYDKEKGLALCVMKKVFGNKSKFNDILHEWVDTDDKEEYSRKFKKLEKECIKKS